MKVQKKVIIPLLIFLSLSLNGCNNPPKTEDNTAIEIPTGKTLLEFGGRSSTKIISKDGKVIYIDPYVGDYSEPADLVLITHEHEDHNALTKVKQKDDTKIIRAKDAMSGDNYNDLEEKGFKIKAVPAYNKNHSKGTAVGYIIEVDGIKIYHSGDTSKIDEMNSLKDLNIDYALLPYDGEFNMGPDEMIQCAKIINSKYVIPIHGISKKATDINLDNLKILAPNDRIEL